MPNLQITQTTTARSATILVMTHRKLRRRFTKTKAPTESAIPPDLATAVPGCFDLVPIFPESEIWKKCVEKDKVWDHLQLALFLLPLRRPEANMDFSWHLHRRIKYHNKSTADTTPWLKRKVILSYWFEQIVQNWEEYRSGKILCAQCARHAGAKGLRLEEQK